MEVVRRFRGLVCRLIIVPLLLLLILTLPSCGNLENADLPEDAEEIPLEERKKIEDVDFADAQLKTCINSYNLTYVFQVKTLTCNSRGISDLKGLENFSELIHLELDSNKLIKDISSLQTLTEITTLYMRDNTVDVIGPLSSLVMLTNLDLGSNAISDISPLRYLTRLSYLSIENNGISDLTALHGLDSLISINAGRNAISDLTPLQDITTLLYVYLYENSISDISPLRNLENLVYLTLNKNLIRDVGDLEPLVNLNALHLQDNQIDTGVDRLTTLVNIIPSPGYQLNLAGNASIPCNQWNTLKNALGERVVDISSDLGCN